MKNITAALLLSLILASPARSQGIPPADPSAGILDAPIRRPWRFFLAGGYPLPVGVVHHWMDGQYSVSGGFTYKQPAWPVGLQFDGMTHRFSFNSRAEEFAQSEGYMQITAGTANLFWEVPRSQSNPRMTSRLLGGVGIYNRVIKTTENRLAVGTCFDPWWGYFPCAGDVTVTTKSASVTKLGVNGGVTLGYELADIEVFLSTRLHIAFTSKEETLFLPIEAGFRW